MKLSMWQLAEWLKKYKPVIRIRDGEAIIRNVRFLSGEKELSPTSVYIGHMKEYAGEENDKIICVNQKDFLLLNSNDVTEVFNDILDAFDYYNGWSDHLLNQIHSGCSMDELLNGCKSMFDGALIVADSGYLVKSAVNLEKFKNNPNGAEIIRSGIMPLDTILVINKDNRIRKRWDHAFVLTYEALGLPCICKNLFSGNKHVGWLIGIIDSLAQANINQQQIADEIGNLVEAWININEEQLVLASSAELLSQILEGQYESRDVEERKMVSIGWYPKDPKRLYYIGAKSGDPSLKDVLKRKVEYFLKGCYFLDRQTHFVIIRNLNLSPDHEYNTAIETTLAKINMYCGISPEFTDIFALGQMLDLAAIAWKYGNPKAGCMTQFEQCAMPYAVDILKQHTYSGFIHPAIGILQEYDHLNGTDLLVSLQAFLENECNTVDTAKKLSIHRNSLQYRLKRIKELTNLNLTHIDNRMHLLLSLKMVQ